MHIGEVQSAQIELSWANSND